jgi:inner membrane protein
VDPIAHTFTGAALAAAGLRRATPLAPAALILGANAPDVDVVAMLAGGFSELAFRRGWTHGVLALALWPFVLTGLLLLWDRCVRRRRNREAAPARAGPLLALSALAVLTHPTLDWLNDYGIRWLMPFDGTWFYGDALVVIDPWVWLGLGGVLFLTYSTSRLAIARWTVFWTLASLLVLLNAQLVPLPARVLWVCSLIALAALRVLRAKLVRGERTLERAAVAVLALFAVYMAAASTATRAARTQVRAVLAARGIGDVERVMVAPAIANPFAGFVVAATADTYYTGDWRWLASPRFEPNGETWATPRGPAFDAASLAPAARNYLAWSRFPLVETEPAGTGETVVRFFDARYRLRGGLDGPAVRLDADLRVLAAE